MRSLLRGTSISVGTSKIASYVFGKMGITVPDDGVVHLAEVKGVIRDYFGDQWSLNIAALVVGTPLFRGWWPKKFWAYVFEQILLHQ